MSHNKGAALLGVLFLLVAAIVGVTVVTNKNITLNPSKMAGGIYPTPPPTSKCIGYCFSNPCSEAGMVPDNSGACPVGATDIRMNCCKPTPTTTPTPKPFCDYYCMKMPCSEYEGFQSVDQNCYTDYCCRRTDNIQVVKITSGTCAQKCASISGKCLSVGIDSNGTSGQVMSWGNFSSCAPRKGTCNSTVKKLPSGEKTCSGYSPEWTMCRCQINPYVN